MTDDLSVNELLRTKGMAGMLNTIWLIMAMILVVLWIRRVCLRVYAKRSRFAKVQDPCGHTVAPVFFNLTASDQYIAIVVPGRMFLKRMR